MAKVWIVTQGRYSDYHIVKVFSDADKANGFVAHRRATGSIWSRDMQVEEWAVDRDWTSGYVDWRVTFFDTGVVAAERDDDAPTAFEIYRSGRHPDRTQLWVQARDEAHALKVASERHSEWLARRAGVADWPLSPLDHRD